MLANPFKHPFVVSYSFTRSGLLLYGDFIVSTYDEEHARRMVTKEIVKMKGELKNLNVRPAFESDFKRLGVQEAHVTRARLD